MRLTRRHMLTGSLAVGGVLLSEASAQGSRRALRLQIAWLPGINQIGEMFAMHAGYYDAERLDVSMEPGGPNFDGLAVVASGQRDVGQLSSSPSIMLAVSEGIPIKCFAVGLQKHPFAFFSLNDNPVRHPVDFIGKTVGIEPTSLVLLRAVLAKHGIPEERVAIVPIGNDMRPLVNGQVDVVTGWLSNADALKVIGPGRVDLTLWDCGVRLYALPYYATVDLLKNRFSDCAAFLRATARGWHEARRHPDDAVDMLLRSYPALDRQDQRNALESLLPFAFSALTDQQGWGAMEQSLWGEQIQTYEQLDQFTASVPTVEQLMTPDVLVATLRSRLEAA